MKLAFLTTVAFVSLVLFRPASAEEAVKQIDRVCVGRMMIVQTMDLVKERGKTEQQYRDENPFDPMWDSAMREEVSAVIDFVWSHSHDENVNFSDAVMRACYAHHAES